MLGILAHTPILKKKQKNKRNKSMANFVRTILRKQTQVIAHFFRRTRNTDRVLRQLGVKSSLNKESVSTKSNSVPTSSSSRYSEKEKTLSNNEGKSEKSKEFEKENLTQKREKKQKIHLAAQRNKFKSEARAAKYYKEDSGASHFLNEKEINERIYKSKELNDFLGLYHAHKFTFSVNNLVTLIIRYAKVFAEGGSKIKIYKKDKRLQTLLFSLEQNLSFFSAEEKIMLRKFYFKHS